MTLKIAVDLTPLRAGGENGGAKVLAWHLLEQFQALQPDFTFLLLTASWNHEELAVFEGARCSRLCVLAEHAPPMEKERRTELYLERVALWLRRSLPLSWINRLRPAARRLKGVINRRRRLTTPGNYGTLRLREKGVDLLFCPFTAVVYAEPDLPVISFVHDLQHRVYSQFFAAEEVAGRDSTFAHAAHRADIFICNSDYTRRTLLAHFEQIAPEQTYVIPISVHRRLEQYKGSKANREKIGAGILAALPRPYLFYPANYWPHKNHRMLLTAYNALLARRPALQLDLVFTGARSGEETRLRTAVSRMSLSQRVHFLGYLSDEALATVYQGCTALIYPSLYEGFGIPLLEAFAFDKPVLCSNVTSLPEVAGTAACYFDPRKPTEIMAAIERLLDDPALAPQLTRQGRERLRDYREDSMVAQYRQLFEQVVARQPDGRDTLHGLFADGWLGREVVLYYRPAATRRRLDLTLYAPLWLPHAAVTVTCAGNGQRQTIERGDTIALSWELEATGGRLDLQFDPVFRPADHEGTDDVRLLSCLCNEWHITG